MERNENWKLLKRTDFGIDRVCHYQGKNRCYNCSDRAKCNADIFERLARYEDTEMPPETVAEYKKFEDEAVSKGVPFSRIVELMDADEDGRLVVLPCKVGDTVYFAAWFGTAPHIVKRVVEPYFYTDDARGGGSTADFSLRDFGKSVFLTREEAEAALEEAKKDG